MEINTLINHLTKIKNSVEHDIDVCIVSDNNGRDMDSYFYNFEINIEEGLYNEDALILRTK